jgi:PEGA domain
MSMRGMAALQAGLLLLATMSANAVSKSTMRIKILDSKTWSVSLADNGVPNNCEQVTFDAYCRTSRTPLLRYTLLVQEGDQPPFHISCTVESKWSRCKALPIGGTFDANREKHGIVVYYVDDNGKARRELYTVVDADAAAHAATANVAAIPQKAASSAPAAAVPPPAPAPAAQPAAAQDTASSTVKTNFSSTPAGAEITLDGKYVGNTPSEIAVSTGTHAVTFSLPGFAQWKRDLTVTAGSELTVSAILQKE